jgi:hypothetical protein
VGHLEDETGRAHEFCQPFDNRSFDRRTLGMGVDGEMR